MNLHKSRFVISLIFGISISLATWHSVKAWTSIGTWANSTQYYRFNSSVPTDFRTYINKGANVWTNVTPSTWIWSRSSTGAWIYYATIDGVDGVAGRTTLTLSGSTIISINVKFDDSENWYAGNGIPSSNQLDLWSVAAHEMGHGVGLDHTSGIYCPGNTYDATMCSNTRKGSYYMRTLAGDDRNGLNALYP